MQLKKNTAIIDANVIIRYLLKDNKEMYEIAESFFKEVFANKKVAYVLQAVIAEVVYVLIKLYKIDKQKVVAVIEDLLLHKNIKVQDKEVIMYAFDIFKNNNLDFVDCLICAYSNKIKVFSFDKKVNNFIKQHSNNLSVGV